MLPTPDSPWLVVEAVAAALHREGTLGAVPGEVKCDMGTGRLCNWCMLQQKQMKKKASQFWKQPWTSTLLHNHDRGSARHEQVRSTAIAETFQPFEDPCDL